jgi:RNA polymerase sigma-70 factor (ECF subfamily)
MPGVADVERYSDEVLVLAAVAGDPVSFDELVKRYRPAAQRTARGLVGDPDLAEDIVQQALLRAYRCLPQIAAPEAFGAWLRMVVVRTARREGQNAAKRRDRCTALDEAVLATCPSVSGQPEADVLGRRRDAALVEAVRALPEPYSETIELRFFDDLPLARIAGYQGVTIEGVKYRLRRALKLLREALAGELPTNDDSIADGPCTRATPPRQRASITEGVGCDVH